MKLNLMIILFLISFSGMASSELITIRLKQWDFEKGTPALHRQDALSRAYSYVELCTDDKECISTLWGNKKMWRLFLRMSQFF